MKTSKTISTLLFFFYLFISLTDFILCDTIEKTQEEYTCFKAEKKIKIDGDLADWSAINPIQLQWNWQVRGGNWNGPEDLSALCWLTWDEEKLYFAIDIWDDYPQILLPNQKPWQGEGILLSLRFPSVELPPDVRRSMVESLFLAFACTEQGSIGVKIIDSGRGFHQKSIDDCEVIVKKKESGQGILYEGSAPWTALLPQGCKRPDILEANIAVNDIDRDLKKKKSIHWIVAPEEEPFKLNYMQVKLLDKDSTPSVTLAADTPTRYYRDVPLVQLNVTVTDHNNNYILDLEEDDFLVYENGDLQEVIYFDHTERPITMAILLDTSGSMQPRLETAQEAAVEFVRSSLKLQDQALVMEFNSKPSILQEFTNDTDAIAHAIKETKAWGGTALYDALYQTMERLKFLKETKAIVLLSDGKDESYYGTGPGSKRDLEDVISLARKTDVIIYSIGLGYHDNKSQYVLRRLADYSGGRYYSPKEASDLNSVYAKVGEDLRSQYVIGYYPKDLRLEGQWRTIRVDLTQKNFSAKTRKGYYATKK